MNLFPKGIVAFFVTSNLHKFSEARQVLAEFKIATAMFNVEAFEIQDDSLESIAKTSAIDAAAKSNLPVFVEDSGLFIEALKGFPGPYSSYAYRTIGTKGVLRLMENERRRDAHFHSVVAFHSPEEKSPKCFHGEARGEITRNEKGRHGFGFDPIFNLLDKDAKTFAQMETAEKNICSHRAQALRKFARWYTSM